RPADSLWLGSADGMSQARRRRKQLGGGMRQVGVLAAAGRVALTTMVERLAEDHAHARLLSAAMGRCRGARPAPAETNIAVAELDTPRAEEVVAALRTRGVLASALGTATLRMVTHRDVSRAECEQAAAALLEGMGERGCSVAWPACRPRSTTCWWWAAASTARPRPG